MVTYKQEYDRYVEKIKSNKLKLTPQRLEILTLLLENRTEHFTAEEIMDRLTGSKTGIATVYRTLELFCSIDILKKVKFNDEEFSQFDLVDLDSLHFHNHLICDSCHQVIEIKDDLLGSVEKVIQKNFHFKVSNHELVFRGICESCSMKKGHKNG